MDLETDLGTPRTVEPIPWIEQWECPPLRARLSRHQCEFNRRRAAQAVSNLSGPRHPAADVAAEVAARVHLAPCLECPGVVWWAKRLGRGPVHLDPRELRRPEPSGSDVGARANGARRRKRRARPRDRTRRAG